MGTELLCFAVFLASWVVLLLRLSMGAYVLHATAVSMHIDNSTNLGIIAALHLIGK